MITSRQLVRLIVFRQTFNRLASVASATTTPNTVKEALKELRKQTGYSYVNCRKALDEFGPNNIEEAIKWLKQRAIKEGWEKAAKLGDRPTRHGVVSVLVNGNRAAIVEVNCETDFVSRNENFKKLVQDVAEAVVHTVDQSTTKKDGFNLVNLNIDSLRITENSKPVKDLITEAIGKLGENITLAKAQLLMVQPDVQLFSYAHPKEDTGTVCMGRYVSIVGLRRSSSTQFPTEKLGQQLCQHIIGMRSLTLGTPPPENEEKEVKAEETKSEEDDLNAFYDGKITHIDENEVQLLRQAFMLNPTQTVHEYITGHGASIVDFYRVELGENVKEEACNS